MNTSLVVTTYNWPEALELCLLSVLRQSVRPDEVIVADDGSGEPTRARLEELQTTYPLPLRHVWHPDEGFQLSRIRNRALAVARGDYILQVDGDVMLHKHFIQDHLNFRKRNFGQARTPESGRERPGAGDRRPELPGLGTALSLDGDLATTLFVECVSPFLRAVRQGPILHSGLQHELLARGRPGRERVQ